MAALPTDAEPAASAAADRMVKIEMEAAEALAGLAHFTSRRSAGGSGGKWGRGARRMTKRAKSESPPAPQPQPQPQRRTPSRSALEPGPACGSAARRADPPEESLCEQQLENMSVNVVAEQVKAEEDTDLLNGGSNMCSTSYLSLGVSRSRQNLNEAEKEEKRLRRVLANRESARRTIRRRQAVPLNSLIMNYFLLMLMSMLNKLFPLIGLTLYVAVNFVFPLSGELISAGFMRRTDQESC
ncbi:hypothetical protein EUGRSUZ_K02061 [Eucalyptus grandis]|uniref:BZIP domain-containing protein n=2 Tax=Eucalyptus grandis TaxID=71139 RepID=A0A059A4S9_EUCGR|nr:hypothetical protein EUGRSUZ_K02061 [Eucalyptus grandis]